MIEFFGAKDIPEDKITEAVAFCKYKDKWIFCKPYGKDTYEIPYACKNEKEPIQTTIKREITNYTGAEDCTIQQVYTYTVENEGETTYGKIFFAELQTLKEIPNNVDNSNNAKIESISFEEKFPKNATCQDLHYAMFVRIQWWLNSFGVEDELWDVYDENKLLTGRTHKRGELMKKGDYHLVVHIVVKNSKGQFLVTKRAPNKAFPNTWEFTGGSAIMGDDSISAAMREVREETGFELLPENGKLVMSKKMSDCFSDMWLFNQDFDIEKVVLQERETVDAKFVNIDELWELINQEIFSNYDFLPELIELVK